VLQLINRQAEACRPNHGAPRSDAARVERVVSCVAPRTRPLAQLMVTKLRHGAGRWCVLTPPITGPLQALGDHAAWLQLLPRPRQSPPWLCGSRWSHTDHALFFAQPTRTRWQGGGGLWALGMATSEREDTFASIHGLEYASLRA